MAKKKDPPTREEQFKADIRAVEKANFQEILKNHICSVRFTKVDGTERVMKCTLKTDLLPPGPAKEDDGKEKKDFPTTVPVYDLEKNSWRSFRVDSLQEITIVE